MMLARSISPHLHRQIARNWVAQAMRQLDHPECRAADTPMFRLDCPELSEIAIYIKDESLHPSGSLKHRLARALFAHAICRGDVGPETTIVEASSGSSAISEAWFARQLGLPFVAVVPASTAPAKVAAIRWSGGEVVKAALGQDICDLAERVAAERSGHFMDQFRRAAEVSDWLDSDNIATNLVAQSKAAHGEAPRWIVVGAGTGGTSATIGRHIRYRPELATTRLCVVDPEGSAFFKSYTSGDTEVRGRASPVVEGIGRARVEPSFLPAVVDRMLAIPDIASVAGAHWLEERCQKRFGPSTGTNIIGALLLATRMSRRGKRGAIVTLACDGGERYLETIYSEEWLASNALDLKPWRDLPQAIRQFTP